MALVVYWYDIVCFAIIVGAVSGSLWVLWRKEGAGKCVEIISRESIKPSSPTPPHLRTFKLSLLDQIVPLIYSPLIFFFNAISNTERKTVNPSDQLKKSLSEILSQYYPFAGRLDDGSSNIINCNDEGADYIEAHVDCELSKFLWKPEIEVLNHFLPCHSVKITEPAHSLAQLAIQVNNFDCGGLAIGMCFLHKIIDASSLVAFIKDWASIACGSSETVSPIFLQDSFYPSRDLSELFPNVNVDESSIAELIRTRKGRFVFTGSSIAALKANVMSNSISSSTILNHPTRVEIVSSLILQRIMAAYRAKPSPKRPPLIMARHIINMRWRLVPPLPGNTIGNMVWESTLSLMNESESKLVDLVLQLREATRKIDSEYLREFQGEKGILRWLEDLGDSEQIYSKERVDSCIFNSLCRFPFYEVDFGWGKPVWVSLVNEAGEGKFNTVNLMDTREGDGIEAWVNLDEQIMAVLERDDMDFLAFASSNPSVDGISVTRS